MRVGVSETDKIEELDSDEMHREMIECEYYPVDIIVYSAIKKFYYDKH